MSLTNIILTINIVLLGIFFARLIFNYFKNFKKRYFNAGIKLGADKTVSAIMAKAKEGKVFKLRDDHNIVELIIVNKKEKNDKPIIPKRPKGSCGQ